MPGLDYWACKPSLHPPRTSPSASASLARSAAVLEELGEADVLPESCCWSFPVGVMAVRYAAARGRIGSVTSVVIAVIALAGSIGSSALVLYGQFYSQRREVERALRLYREPLISSAYDLQSRIYNILRQDFLAYVREDRWGRGTLALDTTIFAVCQYFGWREILRQEIQLLEFETQEIGRLLSGITGKLGSDALGREFLLWKPEQRGIGEAMIGKWRDGPSCVGYLEFSRRRAELAPWIEGLQTDLVALSQGQGDTKRLEDVQDDLVYLIKALDPKQLRDAPERLSLACGE
jgi:hypothetical protein